MEISDYKNSAVLKTQMIVKSIQVVLKTQMIGKSIQALLKTQMIVKLVEMGFMDLVVPKSMHLDE